MLDGNHVNELMSAIMPHVKVNEIKEVIPSMNDIFIKVVTKSPEDNG